MANGVFGAAVSCYRRLLPDGIEPIEDMAGRDGPQAQGEIGHRGNASEAIGPAARKQQARFAIP